MKSNESITGDGSTLNGTTTYCVKSHEVGNSKAAEVAPNDLFRLLSMQQIIDPLLKWLLCGGIAGRKIIPGVMLY